MKKWSGDVAWSSGSYRRIFTLADSANMVCPKHIIFGFVIDVVGAFELFKLWTPLGPSVLNMSTRSKHGWPPAEMLPRRLPQPSFLDNKKCPNNYKHSITETKSEIVKSIKCVRSEIHRSPKQFIYNRLSDIRLPLKRCNGHNLLFQNNSFRRSWKLVKC